MIAFDIETGSLPSEELAAVLPAFDPLAAVPDPGFFDEKSVKLGRTKDPVKVAAAIDEARRKHEEAVATADKRRAQAALDWTTKTMSEAALSPFTGRVLAIGFRDGAESTVFHIGEGQPVADRLLDRSLVPVGSEAELLKSFWKLIVTEAGERFVGHYIYDFDLPFLVVRSRILAVKVPNDIVRFSGRYPNWAAGFIDTHKLWSFGGQSRGPISFSLDDVCRATGGPTKPVDANGAPIKGDQFAPEFLAGGPRREAALNYLFNDLDMAWHVAALCGIE